MKQTTLNIINSKGVTVSFNAVQPESNNEITAYLGNNSQYEAMICFPIAPEICIQPSLFQHNRGFNFDVLSIDWMGNIKNIHHNASPEESLKLYPDSVCIIIAKAGLCKSNDIEAGDSVIHDKFRILSDNTVVIKNHKFKKISLDTLQKINPDDVLFIEYTLCGNNHMIRQSALIVTTTNEYFIDHYPEKYGKEFYQLLSEAHLCKLYLHYDGVLLVKMGYEGRFIRFGYTEDFNDWLRLVGK